MGQILVRQVDDAAIVRLKARAKLQNKSLEALARDALHREAKELSVDEKLALIRALQAKMSAAMVPGVRQTPAVELIREDRDR